MDKDEMIDKLDQILEWSGESLENQVGKVKSIKVKFKKVKKLKGSKLEDKQEDYEDEYDIKVSQVARVEGTVKVKGKDDDIENDFTMYVYKRGGKWYFVCILLNENKSYMKIMEKNTIFAEKTE